MQNRYVGDIGDFAKYGLLRALARGHQLGVAWYLYPDESHNADGKHITYLNNPEKWRDLDPELFDRLQSLVGSNRRSVQTIETSRLLDEARFSSVALTFAGDRDTRALQRANWFKGVLSDLRECDLVFADPDNGLYLDHKYAMAARNSWKSMPLSEAHVLAAGRTGIIYHHNTRRAGGHAKEIQYWLSLLDKDAMALYWRHLSNRTFFIVHPSSDFKMQVRKFANKWAPYFELHERQTNFIAKISDKPSQPRRQFVAGKSCPECRHAFKGNGWGGIDAHWKARHEHIMPYSLAWPLIKQGIRPSETDK